MYIYIEMYIHKFIVIKVEGRDRERARKRDSGRERVSERERHTHEFRNVYTQVYSD